MTPPYPPGSPSRCLRWVLFPVSRYWNTRVSFLGPLFRCPCFDDLTCSYLLLWCHRVYPDDTRLYSSLDLSLSSDSYTQPFNSLLKCVTSKSEFLVSLFNCTQPVFPFLSNDIATDPVTSTPNPKHPWFFSSFHTPVSANPIDFTYKIHLWYYCCVDYCLTERHSSTGQYILILGEVPNALLVRKKEPSKVEESFFLSPSRKEYMKVGKPGGKSEFVHFLKLYFPVWGCVGP